MKKNEIFNLIDFVLKKNKVLKKKAKLKSSFFVKNYSMENIVNNFFKKINL